MTTPSCHFRPTALHFLNHVSLCVADAFSESPSPICPFSDFGLRSVLRVNSELDICLRSSLSRRIGAITSLMHRNITAQFMSVRRLAYSHPDKALLALSAAARQGLARDASRGCFVPIDGEPELRLSLEFRSALWRHHTKVVPRGLLQVIPKAGLPRRVRHDRILRFGALMRWSPSAGLGQMVSAHQCLKFGSAMLMPLILTWPTCQAELRV